MCTVGLVHLNRFGAGSLGGFENRRKSFGSKELCRKRGAASALTPCRERTYGDC